MDNSGDDCYKHLFCPTFRISSALLTHSVHRSSIKRVMCLRSLSFPTEYCLRMATRTPFRLRQHGSPPSSAPWLKHGSQNWLPDGKWWRSSVIFNVLHCQPKSLDRNSPQFGSPMLLLEAVHVRTADFFARNATLYSTKFSCNGRETLLAEVFRWLMTSDLITRKWSQTNRQALPQCNLTTFSNVNRFSGAKTCEDNLYTTRIDSYIELSVAVSAWFGPACPPVFVGHSWRCSHFFWPRHNRCGHPDVGSTPKWWHPNRFL
jgi:hypothetical protein